MRVSQLHACSVSITCAEVRVSRWALGAGAPAGSRSSVCSRSCPPRVPLSRGTARVSVASRCSQSPVDHASAGPVGGLDAGDLRPSRLRGRGRCSVASRMPLPRSGRPLLSSLTGNEAADEPNSLAHTSQPHSRTLFACQVIIYSQYSQCSQLASAHAGRSAWVAPKLILRPSDVRKHDHVRALR